MQTGKDMYVWGLRLLIKMATHFSHVCIHTLHAYRHAKSLQSCLTLCDPMNCNPTRLLCPWDSPAKNTRVGCHSLSPGNLPNPGIEPKSHMSPALADRFLIPLAPFESPQFTPCNHLIKNWSLFTLSLGWPLTSFG